MNSKVKLSFSEEYKKSVKHGSLNRFLTFTLTLMMYFGSYFFLVSVYPEDTTAITGGFIAGGGGVFMFFFSFSSSLFKSIKISEDTKITTDFLEDKWQLEVQDIISEWVEKLEQEVLKCERTLEYISSSHLSKKDQRNLVKKKLSETVLIIESPKSCIEYRIEKIKKHILNLNDFKEKLRTNEPVDTKHIHSFAYGLEKFAERTIEGKQIY